MYALGGWVGGLLTSCAFGVEALVGEWEDGLDYSSHILFWERGDGRPPSSSCSCYSVRENEKGRVSDLIE